MPSGEDMLMTVFASGKPYQTSVSEETYTKRIKN